MIKALTNAQMREADTYTINVLGVSGEELMLRAGEAVFEEVKKVAAERNFKKITVVCGNGNNGGDGFVCAERLFKEGFDVKVFAFSGKLSTDCAREKERYGGEYIDCVGGDIIVDCIFGTGLSRQVDGKYREVIEQINLSGAYVISADIPSGLNGDNGLVMGVAVKARLTVAIAQVKTGFYLGDGRDLCGEIVKKDIGITADGRYAQIYEERDIKAFFPERKSNTHKGTYGSAGIIAGSEKYRGAAALSAEAALRSGCGYVKLTSCKQVISSLVTALPQVIYLEAPDFACDAIAVGMGCGKSERLYGEIKNILENYKGKLIIDADGLNVIAEYGVAILDNKYCDVLLTPHVKEFSRLSGLTVEEILSDPVKAAQDFAKKHKIKVLLKGATTVITDGENTVLNVRGTTALAKGGSGDILSGFICGTAARGLSLYDAAVVSAYVCGVAAELSSREMSDYCVTAKEIFLNLPKVVKRLTS